MSVAETPNLCPKQIKGTQLDAFDYETLVFQGIYR